MSKILICGLNGSGKTTLGKKLADTLKYKHIDIEDYYFVDNNDYKYENSITKDEVVKKCMGMIMSKKGKLLFV